jgi:ferric-dicitrate binding protein FerR (iron transport regulator)
MTPRDIESRIQDLFDGKLAPDARAALLAEIGRDPELLDIYMDYAVLEGAFARLSRSGKLLHPEPVAIAKCDLPGRRKNHLRWSLIAAAAVLTLIAVSLHLISLRNSLPTVNFRLSPGSIIHVSHAMAEKEAPTGTLLPGSRVTLDQGTVELTFASGVHSIVAGPAEFTLHDAKNLFLQSGSAWFHVPTKGIGFKVQTSEMTVTDFGTDFGVTSLKGLSPEVQVFKGKVKVQTHGQDSSTETLNAGAARSVGILGQLKEIPASSGNFLTTLPDSLPYLHWSFDKSDTFADAQGSALGADREIGHMTGLENPAAFASTEGKFGAALVSTGVLAQAQSGWRGVAGSAPRSIANWLKLGPGGPETQPIVGWGSHALTPFNPNPAFLTYLRRVGNHTVAGVSFGAYYLDGNTPLDDGRWHHFAVVFSGRLLPDGTPEVACYLDGRTEAMTGNIRTDILSPDNPKAHAVRTISSAPESIPVTLFPVNWCGDRRSTNTHLAIDELYIFEAALSETQVKSLYQNNRLE